MANILIYIFILCIWNSILFYNRQLGVSVILFIIPLLILLSYSLRNKIKNKKGLLFIIPIIFLSLTYMVYDNLVFNLLNFIAIPILFILMYIYTIKPTYNINTLINDLFRIIFKPINKIAEVYNLVSMNLNKRFKVSKENKKHIKSILMVLPIILMVLYLLSSADMMFSKIFESFFKIFNNLTISSIFRSFLGRTITVIILFTYISATINYLLFNYSKENNYVSNKKYKANDYTIKLLLTSLNIIYVIFDIIQIRSLLFHQVSMDITYAEYARQGFFQLMIVSIINISIILFSKKYSSNKNNDYKKYMSILMVFLTFIIIISSFLRMYMYECAYGYTLLRLLVYISLITEVILLIPTVIYIISNKFNLVKSYLIIVIIMYVLTNIIPMNYVIANKNINRYYETGKIDIYYLMNNSSDNISLLVSLYNKTDEEKLKILINSYLNHRLKKLKTKHPQEYNISKTIAKKQLIKFQYK